MTNQYEYIERSIWPRQLFVQFVNRVYNRKSNTRVSAKRQRKKREDSLRIKPRDINLVLYILVFFRFSCPISRY